MRFNATELIMILSHLKGDAQFIGPNGQSLNVISAIERKRDGMPVYIVHKGGKK